MENTVMLFPYNPIRKVPLDYQGIESSAFSVQLEHQKKDEILKSWKEVCVVKNNYLLIPNQEVKDSTDELAAQTDFEWKVIREFFDGKKFVYTLATEDVSYEVAEGDHVGLGLNVWNSYDGSVAFHLSFMAYRLLCLNGMTSGDCFFSFKFKHDKNSEGYQNELDNAVRMFDQADMSLDRFCQSARMLLTPLTTDSLQNIRNDHIRELPVTKFGKIMDEYLLNNKGEYESRNTWDFMNAATKILWHNDKPTVTDYKDNQYVVDGLLRYGAEA